ncbi:Cdc7p-Dbf4p kinase complex regulatory subunit, partial [Coemansia guatemalensis]
MSSRKLTFNAPRPSTRNLGASPAGRSTLHNSQPHADLLLPARSLATPTRPAQRASAVRLHQNTAGLASPLHSPTALHGSAQGRRNPLQAITSREQQSNNKAPAEAATHSRGSVSTEQQREQKARLSEWIKAYRRAFPSFVFYFEGIDESTVQRLSVPIHHLGGKVETFFSAQSVTHVIVEHPDMVSSENAENSSHVVLLAKRFGLKIWDVTKLEKRVLGLLLPGYNASNAQGANVQSAKRKLNEAFSTEKMYAMRHKAFEGASVAHCVDFYHFKYIYVLVEDATHLHRPAIMEDYRPPEPGRDPPWPKLYMVPTGRCPFVQYEDPTTSSKGSDTDAEDNKENMTPEPEDTLPTAHLPSKTPVNRIRTPRGAAWTPDAGCAVAEDSPSARTPRASTVVRGADESQLVTPTRPPRSQAVSGMVAAPVDDVSVARLAGTVAVMDSNASGIAQSHGVTSTSTAFHLNAMDPVMQRSLLQNLNGGRVTHLSRLEQPVATAPRVAGGVQGTRTHGRAPPIPRTKKA